ncbi:hypothetical protein Zmor_027820 [Zophobas morio]|uniref:HTH psq-type domain-containing protein n=1 Tax=Zophobas morio TaxID=2755281 RepID=A0AA38HPB6_9CUCU|nr:hypothetical protein Zmor_027820 [Zophobas morio]
MAPRRNYTKEQMSKVIDAVGRGMAIATAAKAFSVPRTTLLDKISGRSSLETKMGPKTVLPQHEENILEDCIMSLSDMHYPIKKDELLDSVQHIIQQTKRETPFVNGRPGKKWFSSFLKRHPIIS